MKNTYIDKAIKFCGSQQKLARAVNKYIHRETSPASQKRVSDWLVRHKKTPCEYVVAIEKATNGLVTCYDLRPDVFGEVTRYEMRPDVYGEAPETTSKRRSEDGTQTE